MAKVIYIAGPKSQFIPELLRKPVLKTVLPDVRLSYTDWQKYLHAQRVEMMLRKGSDVFAEAYRKIS